MAQVYVEHPDQILSHVSSRHSFNYPRPFRFLTKTTWAFAKLAKAYRSKYSTKRRKIRGARVKRAQPYRILELNCDAYVKTTN